MVFSHSSPTSFCGTRYVGNFSGDLTAGVLKAGEDTYAEAAGGRIRWGDYSGIAQDPVFPRRIWMYNEYAKLRTFNHPNGYWGTWCGQIELENHPPQLNAPALLALSEGDVLIDTLTVVEPDGENLSSFGLLAPGPNWVSFSDLGNGKAELKLFPGCREAGTDTVWLAASDNASPALADTALIEIRVLAANCPPVSSRSGPDTIQINQCQSASFLITCFDPDEGGPLRLFSGPAPAFTGVADSGNGRGSLNLSPTTADSGGYLVDISASDGADTSSLPVPVQVFPKGDLNRDSRLSGSDLILLLFCVFNLVPPPAGLESCDLNGGGLSASDIVALLNATFSGILLPPC